MSNQDPGREAELLSLPLTEILLRDGFNPRSGHDPEALAELAASIAAHGLLQPIVVGPREEAGHPLIAGHRRLAAARQAGLERVPALVREGDQALIDALVENLQRSDLSPIEEARGFQRALEEGRLRTHKALAERLSKPPAFVSERLRLLKLPAEAQQPLHAGTAPLAIAPVLLKVARVSPALATALTQAVASGQVEAQALLEDLPAVVAYRLPEVEGVELPYLVPVGRRLGLGDLLPREGFEDLFERYEALPAGRHGYRPHYLYFSLGEAERDEARAYGCLLELPTRSGHGYGPPTDYVCDRDWVADRVREQLAAMERRGGGRAPGGGRAGGRGAPVGASRHRARTSKARRRRSSSARRPSAGAPSARPTAAGGSRPAGPTSNSAGALPSACTRRRSASTSPACWPCWCWARPRGRCARAVCATCARSSRT